MKRLINIRLLAAISISAMAYFTVSAQDFVAVSKNGNVYDEANAKYITLNQNNENVDVVPGMVFSTSEHKPGWYKVEYSPGLHAFIPEGITATTFNKVSPGTYKIQNMPSHELSAQQNGTEWTATVDGKTYNGKQVEDIVVFYDNTTIAFSLVDVGEGPIAITYDNSVTKFF